MSASTPAAPRPLHVLLVDDHHIVRVGVRTILADDCRLKVVGEAGRGDEGLRLASELQPDVVLLDLRLPDRPGDVVCRQLKLLQNPPIVLILTSYGDQESVLACQAAGADGYLLKDFDQTNLADVVVLTATTDDTFWPQTWNRKAPRAPEDIAMRFASLPTMEVQILERMAEGWVYKEIAEVMPLSLGAVRNSVTTIYFKLGITNRTEAVLQWLKHRGEAV